MGRVILTLIVSLMLSSCYVEEEYLDCEKYNQWVEASYKERLSRCNKCEPSYIKAVEKWKTKALMECE